MESLNWKRYVVFGIYMYYPGRGIDVERFTPSYIKKNGVPKHIKEEILKCLEE